MLTTINSKSVSTWLCVFNLALAGLLPAVIWLLLDDDLLLAALEGVSHLALVLF